MRHRFTLVVVVLALFVSPVLAQEGPPEKTPGGIRFISIISGIACCSLVFIGIPVLFIRNFMREASRGKKMGQTMEEVIDELPKKRQVMFKGEKVPDWKTAARQKATKAALKFLSCTDNWFEKKYISDVADEAFRLVKEAIEARSLKGIERRVTPECLEELKSEIQKLRKEQELHIFGRVEVTDVDVLHIESPVGKENHTFTALISAKSKDFYEDDENGEVLRGDKKTYAYQEFWSFRRTKERWLVELIRPSSDVDSVLEAKNVMAQIDLEEFGNHANPEFLREFVGR